MCIMEMSKPPNGGDLPLPIVLWPGGTSIVDKVRQRSNNFTDMRPCILSAEFCGRDCQYAVGMLDYVRVFIRYFIKWF
jgi:hypothetical protein